MCDIPPVRLTDAASTDGSPAADSVAAPDSAVAAVPDAVPDVPQSAAEARDAVTRLLAAELCTLSDETLSDVVVADALLVTSEIVTNALRHAGGVTGFSARITESGLRLVVDDGDPRHPVRQDPAPGTVGEGGYGWSLVHRLTAHLAVTSHEDGKRIVAVVPLV